MSIPRFDLLDSIISFGTALRLLSLLCLFCTFVSVSVNTWGSEDSLWESAVSFHPMGDQTKVVRLGSKRRHLGTQEKTFVIVNSTGSGVMPGCGDVGMRECRAAGTTASSGLEVSDCQLCLFSGAVSLPP